MSPCRGGALTWVSQGPSTSTVPVNSRCLVSATNYFSQLRDPETPRTLGDQQAVGHLAVVGPQLGGGGLHPAAPARAPSHGLVPVSFPGIRVVLNILSIW